MGRESLSFDRASLLLFKMRTKQELQEDRRNTGEAGGSDGRWVGPRGPLPVGAPPPAPLSPRGGLPATCTHRVLAANVPLGSAVHLGDLDLCQTREFLPGQLLPRRGQILTVPTPGKGTMPAQWSPGSRSLTQSHCQAQPCLCGRRSPMAQEFIKHHILPLGALMFSPSLSQTRNSKSVRSRLLDNLVEANWSGNKLRF